MYFKQMLDEHCGCASYLIASRQSHEAAIVDTPVVNVAFDGETPVEWVRSARRYYRFTHYCNITRRAAVLVANTPQALVEHVRAYLANPTLDRGGRAQVAREQCQFLDGRSAERVAAFVAEELAGVSRPGYEMQPCVESLVSSR